LEPLNKKIFAKNKYISLQNFQSGNLVFERGADKPSFEKSKELAERYPMINLNYNQLFLSQAPEEVVH
jgi:hypothetical protein